MHHDHVALEPIERGGITTLRFKATRAFQAPSGTGYGLGFRSAWDFGRISVAELERLAGDPAGAAAAAGGSAAAGGGRLDYRFDARRDPAFCNGWQSWSSSWELLPGERMRRARFIPKLNLFTDRPGLPVGRGAVISHFMCYLRAGDSYLALVSRNAGGPPIAFKLDRGAGEGGRGEFTLIAYADGQDFTAGDTIAEIAIIRRDGFFALRDALRGLFQDFDLFSRLAFLAKPGEEGPAAGIADTDGNGAGEPGSAAAAPEAAVPEASAPEAAGAALAAAEGNGLGLSHRLIPGGYESWYNHYADINEALIREDLAGIISTPNLIRRRYIDEGRPTVFQIDDGWERAVGDWRVNEARFPRGMAPLAAEIEGAGLVPGLWFAPFLVTKAAAVYAERPDWLLRDARGKPVVAAWMPAWGGDFYCLDLSRPEVLDYIDGFIGRAIDEWGYRYLKLDFLYAGMMPGAHARSGPAWRHYERALERVTRRTHSAAGKPVAYLGCGAPLENSYRYLPLMRIGADTKEDWDQRPHRALLHQARPSAYNSLMNTLGRAFMDQAVFVNDPDVVFCREPNMKLSEREKETVALGAVLAASQLMFSDDAAHFASGGAEEAFTERLVELLERLGGREFGVRRLSPAEAQGGYGSLKALGRRAPDAYLIYSRDGAYRGVLNLGDEPLAVAGDWGRAASALRDGRLPDGRFAGRSASLFEFEP